MLALLALQPPGFGTFAEPAPGRMTYSGGADSSDTAPQINAVGHATSCGGGSLSNLVDGNTACNTWTSSPHGQDSEWVSVDLGAVYQISQVKIWKYYCDGRSYHSQSVEVSQDDTNWVTVYTTGTGYGDAETSAGKTVEVSGTLGRYVRHTSGGSTRSTGVEFLELKVYGRLQASDETCRAIGYKQDDGLGDACETIGYEQEDLAAQVAQLKAQSAQTNELLTQLAQQLAKSNEQLAQSAAQRNILELMSAKAAGRSAADLKAAGFSGADLKAAGFSATELKAAGFFTTRSEVQAALEDDTSGIENWDVSLVDNFSRLFYGYREFNADLSKWDVAKGTDFTAMFRDAVSFDADLSEWDVAQGTNFDRMFYTAREFNADLSEWDVAKGTSFERMFMRAEKYDADLSKWDVAKGTDFEAMFGFASSFNADLSEWNVAKGSNVDHMFYNAVCEATNCGCTSCA